MDLNVGFDMDGVLADSQPIFRTLLLQQFNSYDMDKKDDKGNILFSYEIEGVMTGSIWAVIHNALMYYQPFMHPVDGMHKTITRIYEMQNKRPIQIISARPDDCVTQTEAWLDDWFPVPFSLYVVAPPKNDESLDKNVKTQLATDLGLTHFVEDRFKYASQIAQECPNIQNVFLLNKPYNTGRRVARKVIRVDWLSQIPKILAGN